MQANVRRIPDPICRKNTPKEGVFLFKENSGLKDYWK